VRGITPTLASAAYSAAAACPLLRMKRSRESARGFAASMRITSPNSTASTSAAEKQLPTCEAFALCTMRNTSLRIATESARASMEGAAVMISETAGPRTGCCHGGRNRCAATSRFDRDRTACNYLLASQSLHATVVRGTSRRLASNLLPATRAVASLCAHAIRRCPLPGASPGPGGRAARQSRLTARDRPGRAPFP
jgi:hypothetical protein